MEGRLYTVEQNEAYLRLLCELWKEGFTAPDRQGLWNELSRRVKERVPHFFRSGNAFRKHFVPYFSAKRKDREGFEGIDDLFQTCKEYWVMEEQEYEKSLVTKGAVQQFGGHSVLSTSTKKRADRKNLTKNIRRDDDNNGDDDDNDDDDDDNDDDDDGENDDNKANGNIVRRTTRNSLATANTTKNGNLLLKTSSNSNNTRRSGGNNKNNDYDDDDGNDDDDDDEEDDHNKNNRNGVVGKKRGNGFVATPRDIKRSQLQQRNNSSNKKSSNRNSNISNLSEDDDNDDDNVNGVKSCILCVGGGDDDAKLPSDIFCYECGQGYCRKCAKSLHNSRTILKSICSVCKNIVCDSCLNYHKSSCGQQSNNNTSAENSRAIADGAVVATTAVTFENLGDFSQQKLKETVGNLNNITFVDGGYEKQMEADIDREFDFLFDLLKERKQKLKADLIPLRAVKMRRFKQKIEDVVLAKDNMDAINSTNSVYYSILQNEAERLRLLLLKKKHDLEEATNLNSLQSWRQQANDMIQAFEQNVKAKYDDADLDTLAIN